MTVNPLGNLASKALATAFGFFAALASWAQTPVTIDLSYTPGITAAACSGVSNSDVFAFAEARFASLFAGSPASGRLSQFDYRYYPVSGNYLAVDTSCTIYVLGRSTNNALVAVAPVSALAGAISAWKTTTSGTGGTGGAGGTGGTGGTGSVAACTYAVTPTTLTFDATGGTGTVNVRQNETACTVPNPPWAAASNSPDWIVDVRAGSLSNGQGPAYFYVQPNSGATRNGSLTVAGTVVSVTQSGSNSLQGQYAGTWSGSCTLFGGVSGSFTMAVAANGNVSGTYAGDDEGGFSGAVDAAGSLSTASGVASGGAYWTGQVVAGGTGSGGSWSLPGCSGSWRM